MRIVGGTRPVHRAVLVVVAQDGAEGVRRERPAALSEERGGAPSASVMRVLVM
jgi:hypothetical protein